MENKVLERVRTALKEKKVSQRDLAKGLKISLSTVNKLLNSEGDLNIFVLREIARLINVSEQWILVGHDTKAGNEASEATSDASLIKELEQLKQKNQAIEEENRQLRSSSPNKKTLAGASITFVDSQAILTYPKDHNKSAFLEQLSTFSLPLSRFPKKYRAFEVNGDGMADKINGGDWVICEKVEDLNTIKDRFVYVVVLEYEMQCCRLLNRIKERQRLRLKFDNKSYRDLEIHPDQIKEVWEVKSLMTFSLSNPNFQLEDWVKKLEDRIFELEEKDRRREEGRG
jgi:transcriptional regulator with XRE-family HTH domain